MRISPWARLAPSFSSLSQGGIVARGVKTTSMAAGPTWAVLLHEGISKHNKDDPTAKYCQLATAAVGGGGSCRTWVFRGFWEDTGALKFITDRRSDKIPEIAADPVGEVCFYLSKTREQFRIKGRLQVVTAEDTADERLTKARRQQWTQTSPGAQASFASPLMPGARVVDTEAEEEEEDGRKRAPEEVDPIAEPTDEFCLVLLWPHRVDHLELNDGQRRHVHRVVGDRDGGGMRLTRPVSLSLLDEEAEQGVVGGGGEGGASIGGSQSVAWTTMAVVP